MGLCASSADAGVDRKAKEAPRGRFESGTRAHVSRSGKRERTEAHVKKTVNSTKFAVQVGTQSELYTVKLRGVSGRKAVASEAKAELGRMVNSKTVSLDIWERKGNEWLCDVHCNKVFVQVELVKRGLVVLDDNESRQELVVAQDGAKRNKLGVWATGKSSSKNRI